MRIIAGEHRGRRIAAPPGLGTRPMLDRVREAVFSSLGQRVVGARVLDLFAGSGSLSLEALSRGAQRARAVESDRRALELLRGNAESLGVGARLEIVRGDALDASTWSSGADTEQRDFELAFLDPPYAFLADRRRLELLEALRRVARELAPGGLCVLHARRRALTAGDFGAGLALRERTYGSSSIWYVEPALPGGEGAA